jgi:predicted  nucleic acid-binding Zn-ribbon protein
LSFTEPHDEFLELCAVSTSGQLSEAEHKRLQEHLATCQPCREALKQFEAVVGHAISAIGANELSESSGSGPCWSQEQAEKGFFERLAREEKGQASKRENPSAICAGLYRGLSFASDSTWRDVWILCAAGILLFVTLSFYAYRVGISRGTDTAKSVLPRPSTQAQPSLEAQLSDASRERQIALAKVEERDKTIADLRRQLDQESLDINPMKSAQARVENDLRSGDATRQDFIRERADLAQKLAASQTSSQALQEKLDSLAQQSPQDAARAQALEAKVTELTQLLHDREGALDQKDELLAHDRDIRELMGARDLYVAEVYNVVRNGTEKPFGRVFYTRGKSLIFYAYDLDQQNGTKNATTFQAWGRRGPDRGQALNLGVFYEDSVSKKRWIVKCDDPKTLAQIDGVFVTVEPNGGSPKPSGKSLLFAYLRVDPNHP